MSLDLTLDRFGAEAVQEASAAVVRFGPQLDLSDGQWLAILVEEVGEVARAMCDRTNGDMDAAEAYDQMHAELVQVAAMALRFRQVLRDRGAKP